jgi:hypothetical protein
MHKGLIYRNVKHILADMRNDCIVIKQRFSTRYLKKVSHSQMI